MEKRQLLVQTTGTPQVAERGKYRQYAKQSWGSLCMHSNKYKTDLKTVLVASTTTENAAPEIKCSEFQSCITTDDI